VPVSEFKQQLQNFDIKLTPSQLTRLVNILDEDLEEIITRVEFYDAIEAYHISGEKHRSMDGSPHYSFEIRVLFTIIEYLGEKGITPLEMFNSSDTNSDQRIEIKELVKFLEGISPDLKVKESYAFMNFMDIDRNGMIEKDEFLRMFAKAEAQYRQYRNNAS